MLKEIEESRVVIAIPLASSLIYWRTVAAILEMEKPCPTELMVFQGALVDRARNQLVERMLGHPMQATHLFFLDGDVLPAPDTLVKLLKADRPIIGGVYRRRLPPYEAMAYRKSGKRWEPLTFKKTAGLQKVDYVGTGCLLIHRSVFEKIPAPWFTVEWRGKQHLSEDFSFCEKARKKGFSIYADPSIQPLHLEPMGIGTDPKGAVQFVPMN